MFSAEGYAQLSSATLCPLQGKGQKQFLTTVLTNDDQITTFTRTAQIFIFYSLSVTVCHSSAAVINGFLTLSVYHYRVVHAVLQDLSVFKFKSFKHFPRTALRAA